MTDLAVAIFVKTPGFSPVKTRLAAGLGGAGAVAFHRLAARAIGAVVAECGAVGYWAVAEPDALDAADWQDKPRVWQGGGGLGARMGRVYDRLLRRHGRVLLVGADSPQTTPALLQAAAAALLRQPYVVGPASDGGFWLFGGCQPVPDAVWESVQYSSADTCRQFLSALRPLGPVAMVAEQVDADRPEDLPGLLAALQALPAAAPEQRALAGWLCSRG